MPHPSGRSPCLEKVYNGLNIMSKDDNRRLPGITFVANALLLVQLFLSDPDNMIQFLFK